MKLKKIASLALAGVMAVSMLAGCATKDPETNGNGNGTVDTVSAIVDAVNNGQGANNKVKVTFTSSSVLDNGLEDTIAAYGADAYNNILNNGVKTALTNITGIKDKLFPDGYNSASYWGDWASTIGFMNDSANYNTSNVGNLLTEVEDGDSFTVLKVGVVQADSEAVAAKQAAATIDSALLSTLAASSYDAQKKASEATSSPNPFQDGDKYLNYSYTGNVAMTSYTNAAGATYYYYAVVLTQTVSVKTASL